MKSLFDIGHRHNVSALSEKKRGLVGFPVSLNRCRSFYSWCIRKRLDDALNSGDGSAELPQRLNPALGQI